MTIYNTGNPIGSTDTLDRADNTQNLDFLVAGPLDSYPDRLGVSRKSWRGMENDFNALLAASGFETSVLTYTDGVPLQVDRPTQLLERASDPGILYSIKLPASFPVVLSGTWATDEPLLVVRVDQNLRDELLAPGGSSIVGWARSVLSEQISTVSQMLSAQAVNIWEFADSADKPIVDPSGWIWDGAFAAAIAAQPAGGGTIDIVDGETYLVSNITSTKPYLGIRGRGTIKAVPSADAIIPIDYRVAGGRIELFDITVDGDRLNQSVNFKHNIYVEGAHSYFERVRSHNGLKTGFYCYKCPSVTAVNCYGTDNGGAVEQGHPVNVLGAGMNTYMSDNVRVFGGDYSRNTHIGLRNTGNEYALWDAPEWAATTAKAVGDIVRPPTRIGAYAECIQAGTTGGTVPTWTTAGNEVIDGTVVWLMVDPLANDLYVFGAQANECGSDFSEAGGAYGIGFTSGSFRRVKYIGCVGRRNRGNNFDTNRCWNTELIGCDGSDSEKAMGYNPDHSSERLGLAGGIIRVIGGRFSGNAVFGIGVQGAFTNITDTPGYGDVLIQGVTLERNTGAGLAAASLAELAVDNCTFKDNGTNSQLAITDAFIASQQAVNGFGRARITNNTFIDNRSVKNPYNVSIAKFLSASNPNFGKLVCVDGVMLGNGFAGFTSAPVQTIGDATAFIPGWAVANNTGTNLPQTITEARLTAFAFNASRAKDLTASNAGTIRLERFDNGVDRQELWLLCLGTNVTIIGGAAAGIPTGNIRNIGAVASYNPPANAMVHFKLYGGVWQVLAVYT